MHSVSGWMLQLWIKKVNGLIFRQDVFFKWQQNRSTKQTGPNCSSMQRELLMRNFLEPSGRVTMTQMQWDLVPRRWRYTGRLSCWGLRIDSNWSTHRQHSTGHRSRYRLSVCQLANLSACVLTCMSVPPGVWSPGESGTGVPQGGGLVWRWRETTRASHASYQQTHGAKGSIPEGKNPRRNVPNYPFRPANLEVCNHDDYFPPC